MRDDPKDPLMLQAKALTANLPSHIVGNSWVFEPYLKLTNPAAQNLVDLVLDDVCVEWAARFPKRKPSPQTEQKFIDCGSTILANLLRARCNKLPTTIGMYRSKGALDRGRRYRPEYMTAVRFITVQDWLIKSGFIECVKNGFNLLGYSQTSRFALTERGRMELQANDWTFADFTVERSRESIRMKDKNDRMCGYDDTPEIVAMRANLEELNAKLSVTVVDTVSPLSVYDRKSEYNGRKTRLHRIFSRGDFDHGGRFYGGWWQNIKKEARPKITLDGQHTIEADFRGFNPAVLLALAGQPIPEDPYSTVVGNDAPTELRDHAKATLAALLNAKNGWTEEPRNFNSAKWGMTAEDFRQKVLDAFPMVPAMMATDKGMKLQRQESDLAEAIMLYFVRRGYPILPIHDAFIVQSPLEHELLQVMKDQFRSMLGQTPTIKVIPSYALR